MSKRFTLVLAVALFAATAVHAQYGGGGGGGGGGGRGGGRGGRSQAPPTSPSSSSSSGPTSPAKPLSGIQIIGEIKAIDAPNNRVTIAYEAVEALNWPAGEKPFEVSKTALLKDATVGEKVVFRLDSQQISSMTPYAAGG
jgi:Cu/Ag efflux protein CusF